MKVLLFQKPLFKKRKSKLYQMGTWYVSNMNIWHGQDPMTLSNSQMHESLWYLSTNKNWILFFFFIISKKRNSLIKKNKKKKWPRPVHRVYHGHSKGEKRKHKLTKSMSIKFKMSETRPEDGEWDCYHSESAPTSCNLSWTQTVFHFKGTQISFSLNSPHHTRQNSPPDTWIRPFTA